MYIKFGKRLCDFFLSLFLIAATIPLFLCISMLLFFIEEKVFFFQKRPGKDGRLFTVYKFKTMRDKSSQYVTEDSRITPLGKVLRKTNLDELPQLFNVLFGSMSLVGPRPFLAEYLSLYNTEQKKRHAVKPGITGLAQINGGNNISWNEKLRYDLEYVERISLEFDIKILLITFYRIITLQGFGTGNFIPTKFEGMFENSAKNIR